MRRITCIDLSGGQTVFTLEQEKQLAEYLRAQEELLCGLTTREARIFVHQLAEANGISHPFTDGMAGRDWLRNFIKRQQLLLRKPEATSAARAAGFNEVVTGKFFNLLKKVFTQHSFEPSRIWNVDGTGFSNVPKHLNRIIATKRRKQVGALTSAEHGKTITAEVCVSASGDRLPLLFIFPHQRMAEGLLAGTESGTWGLAHPSGWMQTDLFLLWLKWFVKQVQPTEKNPVLPIVDGHTTHTKNLDTIDYARKNDVTMLCLPPHCPHKLRHLDVSVMAPLFRKYTSEIEDWLRNNPGRVLTPADVPRLVSQAFIESAKSEIIQNGFKRCGIYPINSDIFDPINRERWKRWHIAS